MERNLKLLIILFSIASLSFNSYGDDFKFNISKWREFSFQQNWSTAKEQLAKSCIHIDDFTDEYVQGFNCGKWLGLDIDIVITPDEGGFWGFRKKLYFIIIKFDFSKHNEELILTYLKKTFNLMREYKCYYKKVNSHACTVIFRNGAVVYEDRLWPHTNRRVLSVHIRSEGTYKDDAFKEKN